MALTLRSAFRFVGKIAAPFIPGVGTSLGAAIDMVTGGKDKPSGEEMEKAVKLVEKIRAAKPSITTTEFLFAASTEGALAKIAFDPLMPIELRQWAVGGMALIAVGYMVVRTLAKNKAANKT